MAVVQNVKTFEQIAIPIDFLPPKPDRIIRSCPNNPKHEVYGDCAHLGGRMWLCADCGIEWRIDRKKENMVYYQIDEEGNAEIIRKVPLRMFPGLKLRDGEEVRKVG
ncbi:hypothetical protein [Novibacillus thermophilus]|uniref:Uncharacterized protein n=1 Tax=Novibacillus thermophilus TaxID=1471761 RepID=A0A1U9K6Q1_9BACL|nr:hypothetical protein [Novibacillus thermophilus]AQS55690.1 hypothetical protein B0W44_07695 [Novibacillus thermophilus]